MIIYLVIHITIGVNSEYLLAGSVDPCGMVLPDSRSGKITVAFLVVFTVAMNPPVIGLVDAPTLVFGIASIYIWTVAWGIFISLVLIWAAYNDAFALSEDQVPPDLRDNEEVTTRQSEAQEATAGGSS